MKIGFKVALFAALTVAFAVSLGTPADAKCNAECKQNKAYYKGVWKTRKPVEYQGQTYNVAIVPDNKSALIYWDKKQKTVSLSQIEGAASKATGCKATDRSILSTLRGSPDTPMQTKAFRKMKYLRLELDC